MKYFVTILVVLLSITAGAQQLRYKSGDRIYNSKMETLSVRQIDFVLAEYPVLLKKYHSGRERKLWSGILMGAGIGLLAGDLAVGLSSDVIYPTALTYIGGALTIASIPLMTGNSRRIKEVVDEYNQIPKTDSTVRIDEINIVANQNGIGLRISL